MPRSRSPPSRAARCSPSWSSPSSTAPDNVGNLLTLQNTAQMPLTFIGSSTTLATSLGNAIGGPWTKTFAYDDLYQLTSSAGTHNISATPTFTYSLTHSYHELIGAATHTERAIPRLIAPMAL